GLTFKRVPDTTTTVSVSVPQKVQDQEIPVPDMAPTHYAQDVFKDGKPIARIVVADTSLGSLSASDAVGAPQEAGGQAAWLQQVLCTGENPTDTGCTRTPDQKAIVLSNTPTYTYAPISPTETQTDAAAFESIMLKNKVNVVVS